MCQGMADVYLDEVAQLRGSDEDVGGDRKLCIGLELLIVNIHLLRRGVQGIVTGNTTEQSSVQHRAPHTGENLLLEWLQYVPNQHLTCFL